jgi:uncharacterized protein (DUF1501 family)
MMNISRRRFLQTSAAGVGAISLAPQLGHASTAGYKALVCVFLAGGADTHDVLIGQDPSSYAAWASKRGDLLERYGEGEIITSRERSALLQLTRNGGAGAQVGLPPEMAPVKDLYDRGRLAFVSNVGPLAEMTDRAAIQNKTAMLPSKLRSHNDQQSTWKTFGTEGARYGWGGRMLDAMGESSTYAGISTSGHAVFLSGRQIEPTQIRSNGVVNQAWGIEDKVYGSEELAARLREHYSRTSTSSNPFERDIARLRSKAISTTGELSALMDGATLGETIRLEGNKLSEQLGTIADLIQVRDGLGSQRQVFFAKIGGWDTHKNQHISMPRLLTQLSDALSSFQAGIDAAGLSDQVTLFTASDFGRTLVTNDSGTDHGWGSHHMVMGAAVRGGQIAGEIPPFEEEHDLDFRRGSLIPSIATEQYGAELGRWFGLSESQLDEVFVNRGRFERTPLGLFV